MILVTASIIPFFILSSVAVTRFIEAEKREGEKNLQQEAQALAQALDAEIESTLVTLKALSQSSDFLKRDFRGFHQELRRVVNSHPNWTTVIVHDAERRVVLNARLDYGKPSETVEPASLKTVFDSAQSEVGDLAVRPQSSASMYNYAFPVRFPVLRDGKITFVLTAVIPVSTIQKLVERNAKSSEDWVYVISDRLGRVAGRSPEGDKYLGVMGPASIVKMNRDNARYLKVGQALDGRELLIAGYRSSRAGWTAGVAVPKSVVDAPMRMSKMAIALGGVVLFLVFGTGAFLYSRYLAHLIGTAARGAGALAQGRTPDVAYSKVAEVEQLRKSLVHASALLKLHEKERDENFAAMRAAKEEADRANRAKSEFLANMSHELRTPLGVVLGITDLIVTDHIPAEEREKNLEAVKRNGEQLLRLINDILDFTKVEASKLSFESIDFSLSDLVSNLITDFRPTAIAKGLELVLHMHPDVPDFVKSDPVRIRQIIYNVLGNALKFTPAGKIALDIRSYHGLIEIYISDSGIGINPETQKILFSVFTQEDSGRTRKYGGAGLGLALSRRLARLLGGDVELIGSEVGKGTTFRITFRVEAAEGRAKAAEAVSQQANGDAGLSNAKILLAEDSQDNVMLIKSYLKSSGARIDVARTGLEALELMKQSEYDVVLMDIQMPEMDGYQATEESRRRGFKQPIIALTAHALVEYKQRAFASGYSDFVTKPVRRAELFEVLHRHYQAGV